MKSEGNLSSCDSAKPRIRKELDSKKILHDKYNKKEKSSTYSDIYTKRKFIMKKPMMNLKNSNELQQPIIERLNTEELHNGYINFNDNEHNMHLVPIIYDNITINKKHYNTKKTDLTLNGYIKEAKSRPLPSVPQQNPSMLNTKLQKGSFSYFQFTKYQENSDKLKAKKIAPGFINSIPLVISQKKTQSSPFSSITQECFKINSKKLGKRNKMERKLLFTEASHCSLVL